MAHSETGAQRGQRLAWLLALAGFLPFAALALAAILLGKGHPAHGLLVDAFRTYGAVILSFLGGIRWGMAVKADGAVGGRDFALSVLPSRAAWFSLFAPDAAGLAILLVAFLAQGAWDSLSFHAGAAPAWFARLRIWLTVLVAAAHGAALLAVL